MKTVTMRVDDAIYQMREDIGEPGWRPGDPEWVKDAFPGKDGYLYDVVPPDEIYIDAVGSNSQKFTKISFILNC